MNRRQFAFWISAGLFGLAERLHADTLDTVAAVVMQCTEKLIGGKCVVDEERWKAAENRTWRWFERETLRDDQWRLTGVTTPIDKVTGERYTAEHGYLDESLVPDEIRFGKIKTCTVADEAAENLDEAADDTVHGAVSSARKARDGRPPSKWLRQLNAYELRYWLSTVEVPPVGVSGMTVWTHLTRDHKFDAARLEGLTETEQFKLHAAAHFGY